jgi:hypothetical protein
LLLAAAQRQSVTHVTESEPGKAQFSTTLANASSPKHWRTVMSKDLKAPANLGADLLPDEHLDAVVGGTPGYPGLPLGTNINVSPWSNRPFDFQWALVGATGQLPR